MLRICVRAIEAEEQEEEPRQRKVLWRGRRGWKGDAGRRAGAPGRTDGCEPLLVRDAHSPPSGATNTYGAIGRAPHLLQFEFLDPRLIRRDGCALDTDVVLEDRFGRLDRHLVVGLRA